MIEVECVARGYLTGSGLKEYQAMGTVADQALPAGLLNGSELTPALFSPATKADIGAKQWLPGDTQASFDKQFLRDWLVNSDWDQRSSPPHLPHDIVEKTAHRYEQAFTLLTGRKLK